MHWRLFLMSELLHLMSMSSDALMIVWLLDCCIWLWNNQMHADDCLIFEKLRVWRLSDCKNPLIRRFSRWNVNVLHPMPMSSNAVTKLFVIKNAAPDAEIIECTDKIVYVVFERLKTQQLFVDADETFDVCWNCRLTDWLQNKLLIDEWRRLGVRWNHKCCIWLFHNQMHADDCLIFQKIKTQRLFDFPKN